jgi:succinate dehydrogenase / fumarate reductase, cytochrome b subunit
MSTQKIVSSSLFQKYLMAVSGLGLFGFVVAHLLGNLLLYRSDGMPFNDYAHTLESLGGLLYAAEVGLLGIALLHVVVAIALTIRKRKARTHGYALLRSKGGQSSFGPSSRSMIITGTLLLIFIVLHVIHFKFGPGVAEGYTVEISGSTARDLHRYVVEEFQKPLIVFLYVVSMLVLGVHLRHGFWSAFQSIGANNAKYSKTLQSLGLGLAVILSAGFLFIPIWIYFGAAQ